MISHQVSWLEQGKMPDRIHEDETVSQTVNVTSQEYVKFRVVMRRASFKRRVKVAGHKSKESRSVKVRKFRVVERKSIRECTSLHAEDVRSAEWRECTKNK